MNWRGDSFGRSGIRTKQDGRAKRYFGAVRFCGKEIRTQGYATADQAALAYEILDGVFRLMAQQSPQENAHD